jgi:hypothetical protein
MQIAGSMSNESFAIAPQSAGDYQVSAREGRWARDGEIKPDHLRMNTLKLSF